MTQNPLSSTHTPAAGEYIDLNVSDGTTMRAFVVRPAHIEKAPGIMVFQEAFGVNNHIRDVASRFAQQGFVAIAPELFHLMVAGSQNSSVTARGMYMVRNCYTGEVVTHTFLQRIGKRSTYCCETRVNILCVSNFQMPITGSFATSVRNIRRTPRRSPGR